MIYVNILLIAGFFLGFTGMSWYLGLFRDRFTSKKSYYLTMLLLFACAICFGAWARMMLQL